MTALTIQDDTQVGSTREFVLSLLSGKLKEAIETLPVALTSLSQSELEKKRVPNETDYNLRERLWFLADNAQKANVSLITNTQIFSGICTEQNFTLVMGQPLRLAWIMIRPTDDRRKMKTLLHQLIQKIENEVLSKPITDENMASFMKLLEFLTNRVHGPVVQKVHNLNTNVNMNKPIAAPHNSQERLAELKAKLTEARDVTPEIKPE